MEMHKLSAYICILMLGSIELASCGFGWCPAKDNLAVTVWPSYLGTWYEYASFGDAITRTLYKCSKFTFSGTESTVDAVRSYRMKLFNIRGSSSYSVQPDGFNAFILVGKDKLTPNIEMWQIDTDYNNYSILYSCKNLAGTSYIESSWILTRNRTETLNKKVQARVESVLKKHGLDWTSYGKLTQSSC